MVPFQIQHGFCWAVICYPFPSQPPGSFLSTLCVFFWFNSISCWVLLGGKQPKGSMPGFFRDCLLHPHFPVCLSMPKYFTSEVNIEWPPIAFDLPNQCYFISRTTNLASPQHLLGEDTFSGPPQAEHMWKLLPAWVALPASLVLHPAGEQ